MSMNLGENKKLIKEFLIEISENGRLQGYIDLVYLGVIPLVGHISRFNDSELFASFSEPRVLQKKFITQFPLRLHFKTTEYISEVDNVWANAGTANSPETPKEYFKNFEVNWSKSAKVYAIQLEGLFRINLFGAIGPPYNANSKFFDFRAGGITNAEILEAKNVPGLKDVKK